MTLNAAIQYLFISTVTLTLFFVAFKAFLSGLTHFSWNRAFLLIGIAASLVAPVLVPKGLPLTDIAVFQLDTVTLYSTRQATGLTSMHWLLIFYASISGVLLFRTLIGLVKALSQTQVSHPHSFFSHIRIPGSIPASQAQPIIQHERVHAQLLHSVDVVVLELYRVVFWINPVIYLYIRELRLQHEFEADQHVVRSQGPDRYCEILVQYALNTEVPLLTNKFSIHSKLKNRIKMIYKSKSGGHSRWSYLLLIPVMCATVFISSCAKSTEGKESYRSGDHVNQADFPGGKVAMVEWLQEHIVYPEAAKENGSEGTVHVEFAIDEKGKIGNAKVVKSITLILDQAALDVINDMPDWTPAFDGRTAIASKMVMPIKFELH